MEQRYALSGGRQQTGLAVLSSGKCKLVFWIFCIAGDEFMQENILPTHAGFCAYFQGHRNGRSRHVGYVCLVSANQALGRVNPAL